MDKRLSAKEDLKGKWAVFLDSPFPEVPESAVLNELHSELAEIDGFVAGNVTTTLSGKKVQKQWLYLDRDFNNKLDMLNLESDESWRNIKSYKDKLDELMKLVIEANE
jgi:hypothetical protein